MCRGIFPHCCMFWGRTKPWGVWAPKRTISTQLGWDRYKLLILLKTEKNKKKIFRLLFTLKNIVHMPWCTIHISWTVHQALVKKKKEAEMQNVQTWMWSKSSLNVIVLVKDKIFKCKNLVLLELVLGKNLFILVYLTNESCSILKYIYLTIKQANSNIKMCIVGFS